MSLEDRIEKLTAVMERHNELLEKAIASSGGGAAKPASESKPASSGKASTGKASGAGKKAKEPTDEDVREKFGGFFALETDKDQRRRLVKAIGPILEHFGIERISEVPAENRKEAMGYGDTLIEAHNEGGVDAVEAVKLPFMSDDGEDGGDGEDVL